VIGFRVIDRQLLEPCQMDGKLTYRYDSTGQPVPSCQRGASSDAHTLSHSQFRAIVHDGEAIISCLACATGGVDHYLPTRSTRQHPPRVPPRRL